MPRKVAAKKPKPKAKASKSNASRKPKSTANKKEQKKKTEKQPTARQTMPKKKLSSDAKKKPVIIAKPNTAEQKTRVSNQIPGERKLTEINPTDFCQLANIQTINKHINDMFTEQNSKDISSEDINKLKKIYESKKYKNATNSKRGSLVQDAFVQGGDEEKKYTDTIGKYRITCRIDIIQSDEKGNIFIIEVKDQQDFNLEKAKLQTYLNMITYAYSLSMEKEKVKKLWGRVIDAKGKKEYLFRLNLKKISTKSIVEFLDNF